MAIQPTIGMTVAVASTYGPSVDMTALTNATQAVATLAVGHAVVAGDILEITSGWQNMPQVVRVVTVATNDVTLEGVNTVSLTAFPAGAGAGTVRRITAWQTVGGVVSVSESGGEPQYFDTTVAADLVQQQARARDSVRTITCQMQAGPAFAGQALLQTLTASRAPTACRFVLQSGARRMLNGEMHYAAHRVGETHLEGTWTINVRGEPIFYAT